MGYFPNQDNDIVLQDINPLITESQIKEGQRNWVREEVVILVDGYFSTKGLSKEIVKEKQKSISEFLRHREEFLTGNQVNTIFRNFAGIRMQMGRIQSLDPDTPYSGMQGTKLQKEIVEEYLKDPDKITAEAECIYEKYKLSHS